MVAPEAVDGMNEFVALSGISVVLLQGKKGSGMDMFATVLTYKLKEMFNSSKVGDLSNRLVVCPKCQYQFHAVAVTPFCPKCFLHIKGSRQGE